MHFSDVDHQHMRRALELARRGKFTTRPNPNVGCVIVQQDSVIGEGWHERAGAAHAEVNALRQAGARASGATVYVTLEPCAHFGRTAPCCQALIDAGVKRVVVACEDPFHRVNGQGISRLRAAGIRVDVGLLQHESRELNLGFIANASRNRPWVRLKLGMSLDGRTALADGASKWITSEQSRNDVQHWRLASSAILTTSSTVHADNPRLTARLAQARDAPPVWRVVLDRQRRLEPHANVFDDQAPTLWVCQKTAKGARAPTDNVRVLELTAESAEQQLHEMFAQLAQRGLHDIFVEAGATFAGALLNAGLVDEMLVYVAPLILGANGRPLLNAMDPMSLADACELELIESTTLGSDIRLRYRPVKLHQGTPRSNFSPERVL